MQMKVGIFMFNVFRKLKWFFKKYKKQYTIAIILLIVSSAIEVLPPWILGEAIDDITNGSMDIDLLLKYMVFTIGIAIITYIMNFIWQYQLYGGSIKLDQILRKRLMKQFLKMTPTFYEKNRTGDLMAKATNDLNAVTLTAGFGIMTLIDSTVYMALLILAMGVFISWKLTLWAMLPIPIMALIILYLGKIVHKRFMTAQDAFGEMNDNVLESIAGARVIRAYVQEKKDEQRFKQMSQSVFDKNMSIAYINGLFMPITKIGTTISYMIALGYGAVLVSNGELTVGQLVSFNVYLGLAIWPMFAVGELINVMQQGSASLDRVEHTLHAKVDVKSTENPTTYQNPNTIGFHSFNFQYPLSQGKNLQNISLELQQGQTLGIVGKTGAGKTTFIRQLLREYPLGNGQITINNTNLSQLSKEQILDWIGYVPQDHILFSRSIRENILFGKEDATNEEINRAIRLADFEKDLKNLPQGLETLVGEKGVSLSGGQKQRVSIARALIKNPDILILDDSLSAVDANTEMKIIENIQTERTNKTTIISTHRLSGIQHANEIIVLEDGIIVERGTHQQLLSLGGWYKEQYNRQQLEEESK